MMCIRGRAVRAFLRHRGAGTRHTGRSAGVLTSIEQDQLESLVGLMSGSLECLEARTVGAARL